MKLYRYVGPKEIADRILPKPAGVPIRSPNEVLAWVRDTCQELIGGSVIATFVVDSNGVLLVADRRSEHVACAGGQPVRSAGEITFAVGRVVEVVEITNQSTGYCPEPESWTAVSEALSQARLNAPDAFTLECEFRRCCQCGCLTLVKDEVFACGMCGAKLPANYNVQSPTDS